MQNYSSLNDTPHDQDEQGILYHVAEPSRSKWNHIEDLDSFFSRMYTYHQRHGFLCMLMHEMFSLAQFIFVVVLTTYLFHGINYSMLFANSIEAQNRSKITLNEVIYPLNECISHFNLLTWCIIIIAIVVLVLKFCMRFYHLIHFWDIKQFYNTALKVSDNELDNLTWSDMITKIKHVQLEQQMSIHKRELTELDIYHRILRQENYMVAMVNKHLLPPKTKIPLLGEVFYWTKTLRYNIQGLLFWSPWSPFDSPWHLREDYKKHHLRNQLAKELSRHILWLALINIILAPVVFLWQIIYNFYSYGDLIKREPSRMGIRNWSPYSKLYFRHFNELDHELQARLTRAYRPASRYLISFSSPIMAVLSQYLGFMSGSLLTVLLALTVYDEDVITVEHVLTIITILGMITALCRSFIPDETTVWCPEQLLECVVMHTHYLPTDWKGQAHTSHVRDEFQKLFQMSVVGIFEDLVSPILTPYLLMKWLYPRSLEIVDFFRNFTISVVGVGDVCSFAEMDVTKHGNLLWHIDPFNQSTVNVDQYLQGEDGKVELSLIHFATTNPSWVPPPVAQEFIDSVQEETIPDIYDSDNNFYTSETFDLSSRKRNQLRQSKSALRVLTPENHELSREISSVADFATHGGQESSSHQDFRRTAERSLMWFGDENNLRKSVTWLEGPDLASSANMRKSTMVLHTRRARNTRSYEETTPLLSTNVIR